VADPDDDKDLNDYDPEILRAEAEIARTRQAVASSVMALQRELSRTFNWREWVGRKPVEAVAIAFGVGALLGFMRVDFHRGRK